LVGGFVLAVAYITIAIFFAVIFTSSTSYATLSDTVTSTSIKTMVATGGGNGTAPLTIFIPQEAKIKTGETVEWYNPTEVAEPHTVTFVLDNDTMTGAVSPLSVSNSTEFEGIPQGSNNEPVLLPGEGTNTIIAVNSRTFSPIIIDSDGKAQFLNPNADYRFDGNEKFVNSGWLLPEGLEEVYPGSGNTFSVTFEDIGKYDYLCVLHPWMFGSIVVE
jgi:plastocyanin